MKRFLFLLVIFILLANLYGSGQEKRFSFTREKMASPFTLIFYTDDPTLANKAADACFDLADSFIHIFSDYIPTSELNILSGSSGSGKAMPVSPALMDIILESRQAYRLSDGAFDVTMGPIVRLWRKARKEKQFPLASAIEEKMKPVGFDKVHIDTTLQTIQLAAPQMQLDLGGIAQGYIAQKVLERLARYNIKKALIDVSGDIAIGDPPPGKAGWTIGINLPESENLQSKKLMVHNISVSTSGDMYQFLEHNGKHYSHIIDPKTGYGISSQRNVTIIANNTTAADWLATACSILPIKKAKRLARKMNAEVLIAELKNGKVMQTATTNFSHYYQEANRKD